MFIANGKFGLVVLILIAGFGIGRFGLADNCDQDCLEVSCWFDGSDCLRVSSGSTGFIPCFDAMWVVGGVYGEVCADDQQGMYVGNIEICPDCDISCSVSEGHIPSKATACQGMCTLYIQDWPDSDCENIGS